MIDLESRLPDFINTLTTITASWLPTYNTDAPDGTQCEINIHADTHQFKYSGSNAWPENFGEVVKAMRECLGMRGFQMVMKNSAVRQLTHSKASHALGAHLPAFGK